MIIIAYVCVPKDLTVVKSKIAFNLTKRQLICFGLGAAVAVPTYLFVKRYIMTDISVFLMIALAMPFFFLALYEKNGLTFERVALNMLRVKFLLPHARPYETENFYRKLQTEIDQRKGATFIVLRQTTRQTDRAIQKTNQPKEKTAEKESRQY